MKYPDNSDYVSVIRNIIRNLRRPIRHVWVKGHQDDRKAYNDLDYAAQQNVDVDLLATDYFKFGPKRPMRSIQHIDDQLISLTINGMRYPGNLEANLRWHINGSYVKLYLQKRKGWTESVWQTIDFHNFGSHFQSLSSTHQVHQSQVHL
jgi:hypothetical protein